MSTLTFVDPLGPIKAWLTTQVGTTGATGGTHIGNPTRMTKPALALDLIDANLDGSDSPLAHPRVQIAVQAAKEGDAADVVWPLISLLESIGTVDLDSTLRCVGCRLVLGPIGRHEEQRSRYVTEFEFSVVAR